MKTKHTYLVLLLWAGLLLFSAGSRAEGIEFFEGTFEEAKAAAKEQGKLIFVDAYAVWCGPCKRMSSAVFPTQQAGEVYNKFYINLKLDMEKGEGLEFRKQFPVSAFPTLFYLDSQGNVLEKVVGARSMEDFIALGLKYSSKADPTQNFAEAYTKGDRSPELIHQYIRSLNSAGKPSIQVTNEYLRTAKSFDSEPALRILYEGAVSADTRVFDLFVGHKKAILQLYTEEEVEARIHDACMHSVIKAAEYDYPELLEEAKQKMRNFAPSGSKRFQHEADMVYAAATVQAGPFLKAAKDFVKLAGKEEASPLFHAAGLAEKNFPREQAVLAEAAKWSRKAAETTEESRYWLLDALILEKQGKVPDAKQSAEKALALAKTNNEPSWQIDKLLQNLSLR